MFTNRCKVIVKFDNHHVAKAELQEVQKTTGALALVRLCLTRWSTIQQTCKILIASEELLHAIILAREFIEVWWPIQGSAKMPKARSLTLTSSHY